MVEKRKPLILSSTKNLLNSLLNSETQTQISLLSTVQLRAGILQVSKDASKISNPKFVNFDDSALVGLTTSQLRRLCVTSGSLVWYTYTHVFHFTCQYDSFRARIWNLWGRDSNHFKLLSSKVAIILYNLQNPYSNCVSGGESNNMLE